MENKISDYRTIDFLCFYLLGVTQADIDGSDKMPDHDLLFKCANRAYLDLNRTLKFQKVSEKDKENYKELQKQKSRFRKVISEIIVDRIADLMGKEPENYNEWHKETCKKVIDKAKEYEQKNWLQKNGKDGFYYGQAQKWVNMTIKYMWVTGRWKDKLDKLMKDLHVPVDSYILQGVWDDENLRLEDKRDILEKVFRGDIEARLKEGKKFNDQWVVSWSRWDDKQYISFQENLRKKLNENPFTWEGEMWIKIAKKRKEEAEIDQDEQYE